MRIRAVIFDVYSTILEVGPPPTDAEARWRELFENAFRCQPSTSRLEFFAECSRIIAKRHDWARARGIMWPEIQWPSVVQELLPELAEVTDAERDEFIYQHIQTGRSLVLPPEAALVLRWLREQGILLGIASNSQAYTLRELEESLRGVRLELGMFASDLRFWSFQQGFSKPDPHVFQILTARLEARGVLPTEVLMVGDRLDNDIAAAGSFGWQTWHLSSSSHAPVGGPWIDLLTYLQSPSSGGTALGSGTKILRR